MIKPFEFFRVVDSTVLMLNIFAESSVVREYMKHDMKHGF